MKVYYEKDANIDLIKSKKIAIYAGHQELAELITKIENKRETSKASSSRL